MKLQVHCSMCGKEKTVDVEPLRDGIILADQPIERSGWITQQNGDRFDVYCSKKCAA